MFYVVTLSLRTISAIERTSSRRSSTHNQHGALGFQKFNESLVYSLFRGLSKPIPDHITFPPRLDILPARILLFYFDNDNARAVLKTKPVNEAFCIGVGVYRRIVADMAATTETELRAFILAAGVVKNMAKLRKEDLVTALVLGDYRKAAADRTRITALHTRLEVKAEELKKKVGELKFLEINLTTTDPKLGGIAKKVKKQSRSSAEQAAGEAHQHRYPTRFSLTSSAVTLEDDA